MKRITVTQDVDFEIVEYEKQINIDKTRPSDWEMSHEEIVISADEYYDAAAEALFNEMYPIAMHIEGMSYEDAIESNEYLDQFKFEIIKCEFDNLSNQFTLVVDLEEDTDQLDYFKEELRTLIREIVSDDCQTIRFTTYYDLDYDSVELEATLEVIF